MPTTRKSDALAYFAINADDVDVAPLFFAEPSGNVCGATREDDSREDASRE
ncbi:MAG TPA: hypothetical protein VK306_08550 [Acidimicrobiales bacterium]|nr:hypothetical protein [Acidimicrobiales bacterium]